MTQEDKELLLTDLCARLPYGTVSKTPYNDAIIIGITNRKGVKKDIDYIDVATDNQIYPIQYIKPYLRPMSSMTDEEKVEYCDLQDKFLLSSQYPATDAYELFDWLNTNHFDYRRLIEKGLAIEVTKEKNNPYKE